MPKLSPMRVAILGAGSIGSLFALKLSRAGHDVTMVVRNPERRGYLMQNGVQARPRVGFGSRRAEVTVVPSLEDAYDLVIVAVQRPQIEDLLPTLAINDSKQIMLMFNCASGADQWSHLIGRDRLVWGFPAALAERHDEVLDYFVVPSALRFAQITTIGRPDGQTTPDLLAIKAAFTQAGIPTTIEDEIDGWLKSHAAYMAPVMAMGYTPVRSRFGPRLSLADCRNLAASVQDGFAALKGTGAPITPANMRALDRMPRRALVALFWVVFWLPMAKRSLASHSGAAPREVAMLLSELHDLAVRSEVDTASLSRLRAEVPAA